MDKATEKSIIQRLSSLEKNFHKLSDHPPEQSQIPANQAGQASEGHMSVGRQAAVAAPINLSPLQTGDSRKPWYGSIQYWKILEGIGIIAVVWYAVITHLQWKDLRHNYMVDERALMKVERKEEGSPTRASDVISLSTGGTVTNVGKSVAPGEVTIECITELTGSGNPPSFSYRGLHTHIRGGVIFPNESTDIKCELLGTGDLPVMLGAQDRENLSEGKTYISTYGYISYHDQFGSHVTHFCWWSSFSPSHRFNALDCTRFNDVDIR